MAPAAQELKTTRQGSVEPFTLLEGPGTWYVKDFKGPGDWVTQLTPEHVAELEAAVQGVLRAGLDIEKAPRSITKDHFPLPTLGPLLEALRDEVRDGRGFAVIRGFPVDRLSRRETVIGFWGIGLYWGKALSNNKKGHLIGHIKDIGHDPASPLTRLYATHEAQPYHNDAADLVSLLCLKNARSGGLSSWSSSVSVHNEILKRRPDLARVLAGDWYFDRKGEVPPGKKGYFVIPVFNYHKGYLSVNFSDNYYHLAQRHAEVPRLTPAQLEAIDLFNELARSDELRLDHLLEPGEIQLLSNHTQLHTRSAFEDVGDFDERRHLLRLWRAPPGDRPLPDAYLEPYGGSVEVGNRGGIIVDGTVEHVSLEAE
ncbi:taurine catabolism dioxygenase [Raphidocelis subcapitata]|uniref:Taurine catabolism dioxygenase n=1 Tax=Raphidocelis subcapitata TaxID=307507 RepID=A0A2V0NPQ5_9CHLO|nr:taurine catabolism dioxygenase [Raphidocelis subcapitata]|eukprot:GBF87480.1 taurine catabolism dioxygenase [Raphidocelis subcapitata]